MIQGDDGSQAKDSGSAKVTRVGSVLNESFSDGVYKNILQGTQDGLTSAGAWLGKQVENIISPLKNFERAAQLDQEQAKIRAELGLGVKKADEFKKLIADGAASFVEIGLDVDDVSDTFLSLATAFKTDVSVSDQNLLELAATTKVTGQATKDLAEGFRGVGVSIQEVGERMTEVAQIAREAGVSVKDVSAGVVKNLDKMNIYNFENGTKGLAKMAAQASRLGIDMDRIFYVVDKAFNPESAIEMAAAMQRLGVSTGALLDPLRLMDLSQNDPTELQNQIVNMTKDFVRFNEELGQFEIMPGEKRRLQEIGKELGMSNGELQKMALNAAGLDMKMKQIRFPSSLASKEDRELIATLATVNKQGVAQIKVAKLDEKGERTGEYEMREVSELTNEELQAIKKDQELRGQTMEEIASDQLSELNKLNTQISSLANAIGFGTTTSKLTTTIYDKSTTGLRTGLFGDKVDDAITGNKPPIDDYLQKTQTYRTMQNKLTLDKILELGQAMYKDATNLYEMGKEKFDNLTSDIDFTDLKTKFASIYQSLLDKIPNIPSIPGFGTGGADPNTLTPVNTTNTNVNNAVTNTNLTQSMGKIDFSTLDINEKIDVDINVKLDPNVQNQALSEIIQRQVEEWFKGGNSNNNLSIVHNRLKMYRENNGLTPQ